jgi:hypothetical protein
MSIATALFSDSQVRLFCWLFGQPECSYHLSELGRLSKLGSASLQRELNRLVDANLVLSERVGNLRRFQANPRSPVYTEPQPKGSESISFAPSHHQLARRPRHRHIHQEQQGTDHCLYPSPTQTLLL